MYDDPFSQAAVFRPEWEDEFLAAQYRPSDFQRWLTLVSVLFVLISLAVARAKLGELPDDCTCQQPTPSSNSLTYLLDCRRGWIGLFLCAPFSLALKGLIYCIPVDSYKHFHSPLVVFWVIVTYTLHVGGEVVRDSVHASGAMDLTPEVLALHPKLQNCLDVAHVVYSHDAAAGRRCRDLDPLKTMHMSWPWPWTHGCESMVFSALNISGLCEFQLVVLFLHLDVKAALVQNILCAVFLVAAVRVAGIGDARGLMHAVLMQLAVGTGISVCLFVENEKRRKQFAMAKVAKMVTHQSRALLHTLIPKNVLDRLASHRRSAAARSMLALGAAPPLCPACFGLGPAIVCSQFCVHFSNAAQGHRRSSLPYSCLAL